VIALLLTIFIVPPLARSARVEVANIDFPFEPTSGGGVFLVIIIVVGFAAWNTGNNLLFLVFSLLCSTLFVGWIAARTALRDLTVSARFPDHIFAAEPAPVIVTVRNTKRLLPSFSIFVEARGPSSEPQERRSTRRRYAKRLLAYFSYVPHHASAEQRVERVVEYRITTKSGLLGGAKPLSQDELNACAALLHLVHPLADVAPAIPRPGRIATPLTRPIAPSALEAVDPDDDALRAEALCQLINERWVLERR